MQELYDATQWAMASNERQDEIVSDLISKLNGFEIAYANVYSSESPIRIFSLREKITGTIFNLIPGGTFNMGLSVSEEQSLRAIEARGNASDAKDDVALVDKFIADAKTNCRPVRQVSVPPFLLARFPLEWAEVELFISPDDENYSYEEYLQGAQFANAEVAYLSETELAAYLQISGHTLPSEAQWEYACRAGSSSLFFWGDDLSNLCEWVEHFDDDTANDAASNRFGLVNMGFHLDTCADTWHDSYEDAPVDDSAWIDANGSERVIRGGGSYGYPWQGCGEWLSVLSACRSPSSFYELGFNIRLARTLF